MRKEKSIKVTMTHLNYIKITKSEDDKIITEEFQTELIGERNLEQLKYWCAMEIGNFAPISYYYYEIKYSMSIEKFIENANSEMLTSEDDCGLIEVI